MSAPIDGNRVHSAHAEQRLDQKGTGVRWHLGPCSPAGCPWAGSVPKLHSLLCHAVAVRITEMVCATHFPVAHCRCPMNPGPRGYITYKVRCIPQGAVGLAHKAKRLARKSLYGLSFGTRGKAPCRSSRFHPCSRPSNAHSPVRARTCGEPAQCARHADPAGNTQPDLHPCGACRPVGAEMTREMTTAAIGPPASPGGRCRQPST